MKNVLSIIFVIALLAATLYLGFLWGKSRVSPIEPIVDTKTDTIFVDRPVYAEEKPVDTIRVVDIDSTWYYRCQELLGENAALLDSLKIIRTQKVYRDSSYTAWVSGYEPSLDSIQVYQKTNYVRCKNSLSIYAEPYIGKFTTLPIGIRYQHLEGRWGMGGGIAMVGKNPCVSMSVSYNFSW